MGSIASFLIGIVVGVVVTAVGLERVLSIIRETINEAIPILLGAI